MRRAYFLSAMLFTAMLCLSGIGLAAAEPPELQKNQILVKTEPCTNGQSYTFVINAMSKTGQVTSSTDATVSNVSNVVVKQFTVVYFQKGNLEDPVGGDEYVNPVTESGNKKGFKGDLIQCSGRTDTVLQGLGPVTAIYEFQAFVTPRGKA
ncbi:MAG: hypothetical protein H0W57_09825 [Rubrobacteraceae bacterium]|nr:hypothetical protein [Rubrobacteraceae bacterium]MBA3636701.1 hypothetical protein [Rubrobacteraceae bacterium]